MEVLDYVEVVQLMGSVIAGQDNRVGASWRTPTGELLRLCVSVLTLAGAASVPCALIDHPAASDWTASLSLDRHLKRLVKDVETWLRDGAR